MRLNVYRSTAQQDIERSQHISQFMIDTPGHNHHNGRDTHVRTRESRRRTFPYFLRSFYQIVEKAVFITRTRNQVIVRIEISTDSRKITGIYLIHPNGRKIELRTCHRNQDIEQVVDKERSNQHKTDFLEPFETVQEIIDYHHQNHGIIKEIPHIERLTEPGGRTELTELHRRLAMEQPLLQPGKHMVQVREQTVELKRIGVPVCQQRHLYRHTDESRQPAREQLVQVNQPERQDNDTQTLHQHQFRMVHPRKQNQYQD